MELGQRTWGVTTTPRPNCTAILVHDEAPLDSLSAYVRFCSMVWGGRYNVFAPCRPDAIDPTWLEVLRVASPDTVVFTEGLSGRSPELERLLWNELGPFSIADWKSEWAERPAYPGIPGVHLAIGNVLVEAASRMIPGRSADCVVPEAGLRQRPLLALALFGDAPHELVEFYKSEFAAQEASVDCGDFESTIRLHEVARDMRSPLMLTAQSTSLTYPLPPQPLVLILSDEENVSDFCLFWTLNQFAGPREMVCIWLLVPHAPTTSGGPILANWIAASDHTGCNWVVVTSATIGREKLRQFANDLRSGMDVMGESKGVEPRWGDFEHLFPQGRTVSGGLTVFSSAHVLPDSVLVLPRHAPAYAARSDPSGYVIDAVVQRYEGGEMGYELPPSGFFTDALRAQFGSMCLPPSVRPRVGGLSLEVRGTGPDPLRRSLPDLGALISKALASAGFQANLSSEGALIAGCLRVMGGLDGATWLRKSEVRRLLKQLAYERGIRGLEGTTPAVDRGITAKELANKLSVDDDCDVWDADLHRLVQLGLLRRGYRLTCQACSLQSWVPLDRYAAYEGCPGCGVKVPLDLRHPLAYSTNDLFLRASSGGALPVILALLALRSHCTRSFMFATGVDIAKSRQKITDLDAVCVCDGQLCIVEVKDAEPGLGLKERTRSAPWETSDGMNELQQQLCRIREVGEVIGAEHFAFATPEKTSALPGDFLDWLGENHWHMWGIEELENEKHGGWPFSPRRVRAPEGRCADVQPGKVSRSRGIQWGASPEP